MKVGETGAPTSLKLPRAVCLSKFQSVTPEYQVVLIVYVLEPLEEDSHGVARPAEARGREQLG